MVNIPRDGGSLLPKILVDAGVPVLVFPAMIVGMELTADNFRRGVVAATISVLGRVEFAVFATAYFLAQAPILIAAAIVFRRVRVVRGINLAGANPS